jgi:hypothetical protein
MLGRHRGPHVAISQGAIVVTAAVSGPEGNLLAWRSTDGGKTWSAAIRINDVPAAAREGLHTLATDGRGRLFAAWLDLRKQGTRLYGAYSADSGVTWSANVLVYESPDGTICQCCHPSAAFAGDGTLDVMWRNWLDGSRDLYLIRSTAAREFGRPENLGSGTWKLNACPMDGGGLTNAGGRTVTAWRRNGEIFMAEPGQLKLWTSEKVEAVAQNAAFPSLTALPGGGVLAAWEDNGRISVRRFR